MGKLGWTVVAVASFCVMSSAQAGVTCKMVASLCPTDNGPAQEYKGQEYKGQDHSVPEPASMLLLGAGVSAVGAAVARRRNKNK